MNDLEDLFSSHGSLGRVLLPPAGLTAIVEFLEPTEAKRAFLKLAYTKVCVSLSVSICTLQLVLQLFPNLVRYHFQMTAVFPGTK